jgi:hypothetical protein
MDYCLCLGSAPFIWRFNPVVGIVDPRFMSSSQSTSFECPNCTAKYELVRAEAPGGPTTDREITCLSCGGPLHGREGPFLLKYFLVQRPMRRAGGH